jgi:hypothetical protein
MILYKKLVKYKKQDIIVVYLNGQTFNIYSQPFYSLFHNLINKTRYDYFFEES